LVESVGAIISNAVSYLVGAVRQITPDAAGECRPKSTNLGNRVSVASERSFRAAAVKMMANAMSEIGRAEQGRRAQRQGGRRDDHVARSDIDGDGRPDK